MLNQVWVMLCQVSFGKVRLFRLVKVFYDLLFNPQRANVISQTPFFASVKNVKVKLGSVEWLGQVKLGKDYHITMICFYSPEGKCDLTYTVLRKCQKCWGQVKLSQLG